MTPTTSHTTTYVTESIVVMTRDEVDSLIREALSRGAEALREELRQHPEESRQLIRGREAIMDFLHIKSKSTLRQRERAYPTAFIREGNNTLLLDVTAFLELKRKEQKMLLPK